MGSPGKEVPKYGAFRTFSPENRPELGFILPLQVLQLLGQIVMGGKDLP
jgi:hypothetical protein